MTYVSIWRHPHDKTRIIGYKYVEMTSNLRLGPPLVPLVLLLLAAPGYAGDPLPIKGRLPLPSGDRTHGLTELANRTGWRELRHFQRGASYLSERTVFRDSKTGVLAWKMTADPAVDANDYYDLPTWNADGSAMVFLSSRSGREEFWLMNADGSKPRPLRVRDQNSVGEPVLAGYWGVRHRDRFYQAVRDGNGVAITTINPFTRRAADSGQGESRSGRHDAAASFRRVVSVRQEQERDRKRSEQFVQSFRRRTGRLGSGAYVRTELPSPAIHQVARPPRLLQLRRPAHAMVHSSRWLRTNFASGYRVSSRLDAGRN